MSVHTLKDGDLILFGITTPVGDVKAFRKNAQDGFAKHLGVKVKVLIVVDAPGLFEVIRKDDE